MKRCPTCHSDDPAERYMMAYATRPGEYECDDSFHEPPDLYDPGEARPDPTRYAEWRKNGAGW